MAPAARVRRSVAAIDRVLFGIRGARVFSGLAGFVVGAMVEAVVSGLLDRTADIIRTTAARVSDVVINVVHPIAEAQRAEARTTIRTVRAALNRGEISGSELQGVIDSMHGLQADARASVTNERDERMYRHLSLQAGVYRHSQVQAEDHQPVQPSALGGTFNFRMQHYFVATGTTSITVVADGSTVMVSCNAYDCVEDEDEWGPIDISQAGPAWRNYPPAREYFIELYQEGTLWNTTIGVPRRFVVGREQHAVWYGLRRGTYKLRITRGGSHPVALCGDGRWAVGRP
jgi:hypothetical protein